MTCAEPTYAPDTGIKLGVLKTFKFDDPILYCPPVRAATCLPQSALQEAKVDFNRAKQTAVSQSDHCEVE